jgi:hypothetical protein
VHVEVGVVDVHVPAEHGPHQREHDWVVDEADRFPAVGNRAEHVHGTAGLNAARGLLLCVDPVQGGGVILHLGLGQGTADDEIAILLELGALLLGHGTGRGLVIRRRPLLVAADSHWGALHTFRSVPVNK